MGYNTRTTRHNHDSSSVTGNIIIDNNHNSGRIASSHSLQSLPERAVSPASSTSSNDEFSDCELLSPSMIESSKKLAPRSANSNVNDGDNQGTTTMAGKTNNDNRNRFHTIIFTKAWQSLILLALLSTFVLKFSLWFPFVLPHPIGQAATHTYEVAWYVYDETHTKFDNTAWTYGTDYGLTIVMFYLASRCWSGWKNSTPNKPSPVSVSSFQLRLYSSLLLLCYGLSTLAGGLAHQYFTSLTLLNTPQFRSLWTICVGNVAFASGFMGLIGREVQKIFGVKNGMVPLGPWWFWPAYGSYMACAVAFGYMSFKRPACDIFIAGITQFPTTFYCLAALGLRKWPSSTSKTRSPSSGWKTVSSYFYCTTATSSFTLSTSKKPTVPNTVNDVSTIAIERTHHHPSIIGYVRLPYRIMYYVGFIGNAPLLPMYPLLVQFSGMSLAGINTLLHSWLMVMWGMQGISLLHLLNAMDDSHWSKAATD